MNQTPLGRLTDEFGELKRRHAAVSAELARLAAEIRQREQELIARLEADAAGGARGAETAVTLTKQTTGSITDADAFFNYVIETGKTYLLHRRVSSGAYADELRISGDVPGVKPFERKSLSYKTLNNPF